MFRIVPFKLSLDDLGFLGVVLGTGLLMASLFVEPLRALGVPLLVVVLGALVYGMR